MKINITWMFLASVLLFTLGGCSRDQGLEGVESGESTSVGIVLRLPTATQSSLTEGSTRATHDGNAKEEETTIRTADVFIYSGNGDYLRHEHLTAANFSTTNSAAAGSGWDEYASTKAISTTTGPKYFYVGINLPASSASSLEGKPMGVASTEVQTLARTEVNTTVGLPMFNLTRAVSATMVSDTTANKVTVQVERLVAKVTVEKSPTMAQTGTPGAIGPLTWAINNQNTKFYLLQGTAPVYADPNWRTGSYVAGDYAAAVAPTDYVSVNDGPQTTANYNAQYAVENTSEGKTQKELTRVTVRAWFVPAQWVLTGGYNSSTQSVTRSANGNYNSTTPSSSTPADYWVVTPAVGAEPEYFQSQSDADAFAAAKGVTALAHPGGICYWNFFLNTTNRAGEVLRNEYYKANIISIQAPGKETDAVSSADSPVPTNTTVQATVQILNWNPVSMEDKELVP